MKSKRAIPAQVQPVVMRIAGIDLMTTNAKPWYLKIRGLECHVFTVVGPQNVKRNDLNKMIGEMLYGKPIRGVESFAIEHQYRKPISLAIDA